MRLDTCYAAGSLRDLPEACREGGSARRGGVFYLRPELARGAALHRRDPRASTI